jgi:hypothetical protein
MAAKTGSCEGKIHPAMSHAAIVAAADFTTWSRGERVAARIATGMRMCSTVVLSRRPPESGPATIRGGADAVAAASSQDTTVR